MSYEALQSSVLVLNRSFMPVQLATAQKAFCLLFRSVAEVVMVEDGQLGLYNLETWREVGELKRRSGLTDNDAEWVSTIRYDFEVPRIVRLLFYNRYPKRRISFNRRNIFARDENCCQYCGRRFPTHELSLDHVRPLSRGGKSVWKNVVCACTRCNKKKGGRSPRKAGLKLIRPPTEPRFNPLIRLKVQRKKYYSWRQFLDEAYWSVTLR